MIRLKTILLENETDNSNNALFIGDSQTTGNSYANIFKQSYKNYNVDIDAVTGRNTSSMLDSLKNKDIKKYNVIVIMGGGNDGWRKTPDKAVNNLTKMYTLVKSANPNVKLIAITNPTKTYHESPEKYPSNDSIANNIKSSSTPDYIIDANSLDVSNFKDDNIHLNSRGQSWIYNKLISNLDNIKATPLDLDTIEKQQGLQYGDRGTAVKDMQQHLMYLDFSVGPRMDDGIFGPYTKKGVESFQLKNDLSVNGVFDSDTKSKLDDLTKQVPDDQIQYKIDSLKKSKSKNIDTITSNIPYDSDTVKKWDNSVIDALDIAALDYNIPKEILYTIANIESTGNPNAKNKSSGASGLFQIMPRYFNDYGVNKDTVFNPFINAEAAAKKIVKRMSKINKIINSNDQRNIGAYIYMAHNQGLTGFEIIYKACNSFSSMSAENALIQAAKEIGWTESFGKKIFRNMKGNGKDTPCAFIETWIRKYDRNRKKISSKL
jgi:peptidoglycan hydrolase-like protein with peptidoglycan-binding domain/lysophospholipase L1-like esterase